ncbi:MAG: SusC/RagA family TonB-linked outer membrane protein [Flammeovirgaceae bacterium]|nr:SusC/RagA family TonB-linked outer membrane protein [Flammeovirgaceae bacterium]
MRRILLMALAVLLAFNSWAQERTVTGRVTSAEDGSALPGVNVVLKGTTTGTVTDVEGNYKISVPSDGGTLVFSFIGLTTTEIGIGSRSVVDIQLAADVTQLSEVVVTGYGIQDKRTLTGSVASVKGDVFKNLPVQSVDRGIQGRLAGVQIAAASGAPGGALNVRVRGIGSVNGSNDPLWIVDGVQLTRFGQSTQGSSNPLASINPNDIENVEVLKDASTAAIYGAQAANGVIVVTTKKGKKGKSNLEVSVQTGAVQPLNLYDMMNGQQFAEIKAEAYQNAGLPLTGPTGAFTVFGDPNDGNLTNFDWVDAIFRTGRLNTYDISLSGGDEKTSFLMSLSYQKQEGQIIMNDWQRGTARLNLTHKPTKKLTMGANLSIAYQRTFGSIANGNFVNSPFVAAFSAQPTSGAFLSDGKNYAPYPNSGSGHLFSYNILQGVNEEVRLGRTPQTVSSFNIDYEIIPGLNIRGLAAVDASFGTDNNQRPGSIPVFAGGQMSVTSRRTIAYNTNAVLSYNKKFGQIHSISALGGFEYRKEERGGVTASQFTFPNVALRLLTSGATARPATEFFFDNARQGFFGQVKYTLKDRYSVDATLRRDGSSRFGSSNQYGTFYAAGLGYILSEESFMKSLTWLDNLKVRGSYGVVGNSEIADYDWFTAFGSPAAGSAGIPAGAQYAGISILRLLTLGNDRIGWEEETQVNAGVDFSLFGGRLSGSVDYYRNTTGNQLFNIDLPTDSGVGSVRGNVGEVLNTGIEVELSGVVLDRSGFKWTMNGNIATLKNELLSLPNNARRIGNTLIVGEPIQFLYLFDFAGINPANGKAMIRDASGNLAYQGLEADAAVRGSLIPTYFGGLSNNFSYKGINLEVFFQFQGGNKAFNSDFYNLYDAGSGADNQLVSQLNRWQQPGDITNVPRSFQGGSIDAQDQQFGTFGSTQFMSDASYLRLKQVTLSYNLPMSIVSKVRLSKINVFVQALNLWTLTNYAGIDPEVVTNNQSTGVSGFGVYPVGRQIMAGLTVGF